MRPHTYPLLLSLLLSLLLTLTHAISNDEFDSHANTDSAFPKSITLEKWPLSAESPSPLGQIAYNPRTKKGTYFSLDREGRGVDGLARVGMRTVNGGWFGTVVDGEALKLSKYTPIITLRIDPNGEVFHVEFSTTTDKSQPPKVIVLPATESGPRPHLNKPIVVGPDGKIPQPPVEKTFLQKYWWVLLAGMILLLSGGGGAAE